MCLCFLLLFIPSKCWWLLKFLTLYALTPQNGQTHSNNSLSVFDHFVGLAIRGLRLNLENIAERCAILRCSIYHILLRNISKCSYIYTYNITILFWNWNHCSTNEWYLCSTEIDQWILSRANYDTYTLCFISSAFFQLSLSVA